MAKTVADVMKMVKDNEVKFVDFRFTDTRGKEQHVTVPVSAFDEDKFSAGHAFDGSSIAGWKGIEASDMLLMPDAEHRQHRPVLRGAHAHPDLRRASSPATASPTSATRVRIAKRAEAYLKATGIGDTAYLRPGARVLHLRRACAGTCDMSRLASARSTRRGAPGTPAQDFEGGNMGHRPASRAATSRCRRSTASQDMRSEMCLILE
jgi:glutamine synthetase